MSTPNAYNRVPYTSNAYVETHPANLQAHAFLNGFIPPALEKARVLELGCGPGGNLIPIAYSLPEAHCTGIDFSEIQVEQARAMAAGAGVANVEFRCESITDFAPGPGAFDFIICHGVYSWVPPEVQQSILRICRDSLTPGGIAFISFNVLPGWHTKLWIREAMLTAGAGVADEKERVQRGIELLKFLCETEPHASMPVMSIVKREMQGLHGKDVTYIIHEYLEQVNEPLYFRDFAARLAGSGLRYIADARMNGIQVNGQHPVMKRFLTETANQLLLKEQYIDFLTNRTFRRAVVVRDGCPAGEGSVETRFQQMWIMSHCRLVTPMTPGQPAPELRFEHPVSGTIQAREAALQAALLTLWEITPEAIRIPDLLERVRQRLGQTAEQFEARRRSLAHEMVLYSLSNLLQLYLEPPRFTRQISERPRASALARAMSLHAHRVTNLRHEPVETDERSGIFLRLLDGTRTLDDLVRDFPGAGADAITRVLERLSRQAVLEA